MFLSWKQMQIYRVGVGIHTIASASWKENRKSDYNITQQHKELGIQGIYGVKIQWEIVTKSYRYQKI
jgi:hypothetical protein